MRLMLKGSGRPGPYLDTGLKAGVDKRIKHRCSSDKSQMAGFAEGSDRNISAGEAGKKVPVVLAPLFAGLQKTRDVPGRVSRPRSRLWAETYGALRIGIASPRIILYGVQGGVARFFPILGDPGCESCSGPRLPTAKIESRGAHGSGGRKGIFSPRPNGFMGTAKGDRGKPIARLAAMVTPQWWADSWTFFSGTGCGAGSAPRKKPRLRFLRAGRLRMRARRPGKKRQRSGEVLKRGRAERPQRRRGTNG